ncbi:integrase [Moorella thermoacetica Y72]|uniref:Integrase n=1 Tax=Moorella thermoacetica Y72 TaxID=1325331 RepID=A0A0S6UB23_NEOTH|nr:integrase [Moorella thermoacetica Y72]
MGHATLDMTKRYVALTQGDLKSQHDNTSPLNKLVIPKSRQRKIKK